MPILLEEPILSPYVDSVLEALRDLPRGFEPGLQNWREWTAKVRQALTILGHEHGLYVAGDAQADCGEMGFDLSWRDYGRHHPPEKAYSQSDVLRSVPLVCESEWHSMAEVENDFEKLLQARSGIKLMVFTARDKMEWEQRRDRLAFLIRSFESRSQDEAYLLACFPTEPWGLSAAIVLGDGEIVFSD